MKTIIISGLIILGVAIVTTISILMLMWAGEYLNEADFKDDDPTDDNKKREG